jgi:hypothetical protein
MAVLGGTERVAGAILPNATKLRLTVADQGALLARRSPASADQ